MATNGVAVAVASSSKSKSKKKEPPYIRRLYQDLKHLKEEPIVGINAEPLEHDMLTWYGLVLGPADTKYSGLPIRFCLKFTDEYPNEPPKAYFETHIEYNGGVAYQDESGRTIVCLNIFGKSLKSEGWSPSYSVHSILISMQALFVSNMLSDSKRTITRTRKSASQFVCTETGHNGSKRSTWFPKVIIDYNIAAEIAAKSGRVGFEILRDFFVCCVSKSNADDPGTTLGYGIHLENNGTFSSPCEYISRTAYIDGTRRGATNRPFELWIPILVNQPYEGKFKEQLNRALDTFTEVSPRLFPRDSPPYARLFNLCSSVMNNLVVEIMNNGDNIAANDKFINGYIAFYRLLIEYAEVDPRMVQYANRVIRNFLQSPVNQVKSALPNLGDLLIHLTIADEYSWWDLADDFLFESDVRDVKLYVSSYGLSDERYVAGRSNQVFTRTTVSRNLVMYQVGFSMIVRTLSALLLDKNYGLAPDEILFELKDIYYMVQSTDSWDAFYDWVEMPRVPENVRDRQLVEALKKSQRRGYHGRPYRNGHNNNDYRNGTGNRSKLKQSWKPNKNRLNKK